jgi:hypothetical protein
MVGAGVPLGEQRHTPVGHGAGRLERAIGRPVIDHDHPIRLPGLGKETAERVSDIALMIEKGDDNGDRHRGKGCRLNPKG